MSMGCAWEGVWGMRVGARGVHGVHAGRSCGDLGAWPASAKVGLYGTEESCVHWTWP